MDFYIIQNEEIIRRIENLEKFKKGNEGLLFWATINGENRIIQMLIEASKSNPEKFPLKVNHHFNLALRYAAAYVHTKTIDILLKAGADVPDPDVYKKVGKGEEVTNVMAIYRKMAQGCVNCPERYNYYLLDWFFLNSPPHIFDLLRKYIEDKNPPFIWTVPPIDPNTNTYAFRWKKEDNEGEENNGND